MSSGKDRILYFIDDPRQISRVAPIQIEMSGLQWLTSLVTQPTSQTFAYVWLGLPPGTQSLGGATGSGLLLVNYLREQSGKEPTMVVGAPLVEATHQILGPYGSPPAWVGESLALYFGLHALEHALPDAAAPREVERHFISNASKYPFGLLDVKRRVSHGDPSAYDAYFSKGVAFWTDVDLAMKQAQGRGLATRVREIVGTTYGRDARPPDDFGHMLGLSADGWRRLERQYLEG